MYRLEVLLFALLVSGFAAAQSSTVYKHVDKDGKVTYSEKPPAKDEPKSDGKAVGSKKFGVDNERNVIKSYVPRSGTEGAGDARAFDKRVERNNELRAKLEEAERELEDAKAALDSGKEPLEDEWRTVGAAGGRPARIPTEAYYQRVKALEQAVKDAEEKVKKAETAVRRGTS
ncbi:MAG: DUF4124 domain-containing protein [Burkholderiales bacterium]|nr:DUF4124 domain-containing protein [Burkholderiales bacterium]